MGNANNRNEKKSNFKMTAVFDGDFFDGMILLIFSWITSISFEGNASSVAFLVLILFFMSLIAIFRFPKNIYGKNRCLRELIGYQSLGSSWQRFSKPDPPERGSFPLDLEGHCTLTMQVCSDFLCDLTGVFIRIIWHV